MHAGAVVPAGSGGGPVHRRGLHYVEVSPRVFCCVWLCVAQLHVVCGFYFFGVAYGYWITTPDTALARMLHFHSFGIDWAHYRAVAITHGALGGVHAALLSYMFVCSIVRRRCSFRSTRQTGSPNTIHGKSTPPVVAPDPAVPTGISRLVRGGQFCLRVLDGVFGRRGILGVEGPYFDVWHLALELVETTVQSYQAYRMSEHVPRPWLNALLVGLIVVNCLCPPLLHHVFGANALARRVTYLAFDAVLDLVSSVVVPTSLLVLYSADYVTGSSGFKESLWFSDTWFVSASNEFQLMLVTSWGDMATRVVIAVGFIVSLESAKSLVRVRATYGQRATIAGTIPADPVVQPQASSPRRSMLDSAHGWLRKTARGRHVKLLAHVLIVSWGVVILALHIHAATLPHAPMCAMQVRPWLRTKPACALMLIDCERDNLTHASSEYIRSQYLISDLHRVVRLTIRHCPNLRIPSPLQSLNAVLTIKVYNSTIADWPGEAALTGSHNTALTAISLARVVFPDGQLPAGLMDVNFPKRATSLLFCYTNLQSLPFELATRWPQRAYFLFEGSLFSSLPSVLVALNPIQISFAENQFTQFPFEVLKIPSLVFLNMGGNRGISSLLPPDDVVAPKSLALVNIVNTNVSVLPDWFDARLRLTVNSTVPQGYPSFAASGTPLCENTAKVIAGQLSSFPELDSIPAKRRSFMMNFTHLDAASLKSMSLCRPVPTMYYPLGWEDHWNRL